MAVPLPPPPGSAPLSLTGRTKANRNAAGLRPGGGGEAAMAKVTVNSAPACAGCPVALPELQPPQMARVSDGTAARCGGRSSATALPTTAVTAAPGSGVPSHGRNQHFCRDEPGHFYASSGVRSLDTCGGRAPSFPSASSLVYRMPSGRHGTGYTTAGADWQASVTSASDPPPWKHRDIGRLTPCGTTRECVVTLVEQFRG